MRTSPAQHVVDVVHGTLHDPTLSFQLRVATEFLHRQVAAEQSINPGAV